MKLFTTFATAALLTASAVYAQDDAMAVPASSTDTTDSFYDAASIPWSYDYPTALDKAQATKSLILLYLSAEGSTRCEMMEKDVFTNREVLSAIGQFVPVRAKFVDNTKLAYKMRLFGSSTFVITTADGVILERSNIDNPIETSQDFVAFMQRAVAKKTTVAGDAAMQ